jgi:hypothetical protein
MLYEYVATKGHNSLPDKSHPLVESGTDLYK